MEERITKEELLERLFHDDYENLKGKRLRLTSVRVPGKELSFAHVFTPSDKSVYENLALHIGVHEGEDHRGDAIGMVRVTPCEHPVPVPGKKTCVHKLTTLVCKMLLLYFTEMRVLIERCEISCDKIYNLLSQGIKVHICRVDIVRLNGYNIYSRFWRFEMFEYMTAQETADKWNVSLRWVQRLCKENRIEGVMNVNRVWLIPKDAKKPVDARLKTVCLQKEGKI